MRLRFTKMHGLGNDFIVIDAINQRVNLSTEQIQRLSDRRFGIGCDQLLIVEAPKSPDADFYYRIFNYDGSEVENCGNGARCFAKFVRDRQLTGKSTIIVDTVCGRMSLQVQKDNLISVDMGVPILEPAAIPFRTNQRQTTYPLQLSDRVITISAISMGNPHAVTVVENVATALIASQGAEIEAHSDFPNKVNAGFMAIKSRHEIDLRVYERGVGETLACGTGACAAVVAGRQQQKLDANVQVNLPGGILTIEWAGEGHSVMMSGPATSVFHGQVSI
ncbi:MAG: diaminopimelate epimerase [Kiritimatiellia bacterium]|jgi:diaminopimelate epimerase